MSKNKKKEPKRHQCNICGYPQVIEFTEKSEETGKMETKSHTVHCLGHEGIHPSLWNKHPEYDKFRKFLRRKK